MEPCTTVEADLDTWFIGTDDSYWVTAKKDTAAMLLRSYVSSILFAVPATMVAQDAPEARSSRGMSATTLQSDSLAALAQRLHAARNSQSHHCCRKFTGTRNDTCARQRPICHRLRAQPVRNQHYEPQHMMQACISLTPVS